MQRYGIMVKEILKRTIIVDAKNPEDAIQKVKTAVEKDQLLLDLDDFDDREIIMSDNWENGVIPEDTDVSFYDHLEPDLFDHRPQTLIEQREFADAIAEDFMAAMNPTLWDGYGKKPKTFNTKIKTYSIQSQHGHKLELSFDKCDGEWSHYCELREPDTDTLLGCLHGNGVDSIKNIADTVLDICKDEWSES